MTIWRKNSNSFFLFFIFLVLRYRKVSGSIRILQKIHLYTIGRNEEHILPYFFRHYDSFVDHYVFYDDNSTDHSLSIIQKNPKAEIRPFPKVISDSFVLSSQLIHDFCWKECRGVADWVIMTDMDEFFYHPDMRTYLQECTDRGVTIIPTLGFQMLSDSLPTEPIALTELVKRGSPWDRMNKLGIFNPLQVTETVQALGRHSAMPFGNLVYPEKDEVLNLHYKYLSKDWIFERSKELAQQMGALDNENRWGIEYSWSQTKQEDSFNEFYSTSIENVFSRFDSYHQSHLPGHERWWRKKKSGIVRRILSAIKRTLLGIK
jgi:hypothetical protein